MENYVLDVVARAKMANLSEAAIIQYIINGIQDYNHRVALSAAGHQTISDLLFALNCLGSQTQNTHRRAQRLPALHSGQKRAKKRNLLLRMF